LRGLSARLDLAIVSARSGTGDGVHQLRTTARRLRAALSAHRDELPDRVRRDLRKRSDALRRAAGPVRDMDVLRATIEGARFARRDAAGATRLSATLARRRLRAQRALEEALASPRLAGLSRHLTAVAADARERASPPFAVAAASRLAAAHGRALSRLAALPRRAASAPHGVLHAFRIAVKRARYATEALAPAFGRPVERHLAALAALQDALGVLQDAHAVGGALAPLVTASGAGRAQHEATKRAAATVARVLAAKSRAVERDLDATIEAACGRAALRDLYAHVAKRASAAVADLRR
ncbi:MAG TPA: CHAD domain-containing protein, partial [Planctomycetota bacterium]|nr:CHAD domain-containing protein [Planctomycetota bacterium]